MQQIRNRINFLQKEYQRFILVQEAYWLQRSKLNWSLQRYHNTSFFHSTVLVRRRRNIIGAILKDGGEWAVTDREIRSVFVTHYKCIFTQTIPIQDSTQIPDEVAASICKIQPQEAASLELIPIEEEIKCSFFSLGPTKSPGPDGITTALVQEIWDSFKDVVIYEISYFFRTGHLKDSIAHSILVLIPKVSAPTMVTEFWPISVCNFLYKVISKLLAKRM